MDANGQFAYTIYRVRNDEKLPRKIAVNRNGEPSTIREAKAELANQHYAQYGAINIPFARHLLRTPRPEVNTVAAFYSEKSAEKIRSWLKGANLVSYRMHTNPPMIVATGATEGIFSLARLDGINLVVDGSGTPTEYDADPLVSSSAQYSRSKFTVNKQGQFANGVRVGIVEPGLASDSNGSCDILTEHEAFDSSGLTHQNPNFASCTNDADCDCSGDSFCRNQRCVGEHPTHVASRISASTGGVPQHAGEAHLFLANGGPDLLPGNIYSQNSDYTTEIDTLVDRMDWLYSNGVQIVNHSWGMMPIWRENSPCLTGGEGWPTYRDVVLDWYSRYRSMVNVQASGNVASADAETDCHALNSICVGATTTDTYPSESSTFRNAYIDDVMAGYSAWWNPYRVHYSLSPENCVEDPDGEGRELERPDLVSEGGEFEAGATVAAVEDEEGSDPGTALWRNNALGTSFAAPVVTGLLALWKECRGSPYVSNTLARATLRTAAYSFHNLEPASPFHIYPIPDDSPDSKAGVGVASVGLFKFCDNPPPPDRDEPESFAGSSDEGLDLTNASPLPEGLFTAPPGNFATTNEQAQGLVAVSHPEPRYKILKEFGSLGPGARVRFTYSYQTCPPPPNQVKGPAQDFGVAPALDVDIALCELSDGEVQWCRAYSDTADDTNEGFDWIIQDDQFENAAVVAIFDPEAEACSGGSYVPSAWAWIVWGAWQ